MPSDIFRDHHAKLRDLADELTRHVGPETAANASTIRNLLSRMTGVLAVHVAAEDHVLYPPLFKDDRPHIKTLAKKFQKEKRGLKKNFLEYAKRWSDSAIAEHADAFGQETHKILQKLVGRIADEQTDFYPWVGA